MQLLTQGLRRFPSFAILVIAAWVSFGLASSSVAGDAAGAPFESRNTHTHQLNAFIESYAWLDHPLKKDLVLIEPELGSIGLDSPESLKILRDLGRLIVSQKTLTESYEAAYPGRVLSQRAVVRFYILQMKAFNESVLRLVAQVEQSGHSVTANGIKHQLWHYRSSLISKEKQLEELLQTAQPAGVTKRVKGLQEALLNYQRGFRGELYAMLSLPQLTGFGVYLSETEIYKKVITPKIRNLVQELKSQDPAVRDAAISRFSKSYPCLFDCPLAQKVSIEKIEARFEAILRWIGSKEIDLIQTVGTQQRWIEVKRTPNPLSLNAYRNGKFKKSIAQQLNEMKQILEFAQVQNVELELLSTAGVTEKLANHLETIQIKVHQAVLRSGVGCNRLLKFAQ